MPRKRKRRRSAAFSGLAAVIAHFFGGARPPQEQKTHLADQQRAEQPGAGRVQDHRARRDQPG
jgi:hypothetical protein